MKLSRGLIRNFLAVVKDPARTDLIFKVITAPEILNEKGMTAYLARLRANPSDAAMLDSRYEKPWSVNELAEYPKDTLGYAYARHMIDNNLDADFFDKVAGNSEMAYVQMRGRQTHDIWHALTGFDTSVPGEVGLQAFLMAQYGIRTSGVISAMFLLHGTVFDGDEMMATTEAIARGWTMGKACRPLFGEKFEENWSRNLAEYRQELGLHGVVTPAEPRPSLYAMGT